LTNFWIAPTNIDSWNIVKKKDIYAFHKESSRDRIVPGDKLVFYLTRSKPPVMVGAAEVAGAWELATEPFWPNELKLGKVIHPWRFPLKMLRVGAADARSLVAKLSFVENKQDWGVYFLGSLANFSRPIAERDYQIIFDELNKKPISFVAKSVLGPMPKKKEIREAPKEVLKGMFDMSYIPPILSDLPKLARNDPSIPDASKRFEQELWILGKMLGFTVEELGHKHPNERLPDAAYISPKDHYAILLDAKAREDSYAFGTDDRAVVDYIGQALNRLQRERGTSRVHYVVVSSGFRGDPTKSIIEIRKKAPGCQSVSFITAEQLLHLLELHFKFPNLLTPTEIEDILMQGGIIELEDSAFSS
jgi:predicted RNA-binding protein